MAWTALDFFLMFVMWAVMMLGMMLPSASPMILMFARINRVQAGAFNLGLAHGAYCVGCCWVLMLLLFVGGVMNLVWIAVLALLVLVEKITPPGYWVPRIVGAVLIVWGGATLAYV